MSRLELLTVGEAFQDLIFVGLPHMPRSGEEVRTARFVSAIGGGAVITAAAGARLGLRTALISALPAEHAWGDRTVRELTGHGVDCSGVVPANAVQQARMSRSADIFIFTP